MVTMVEYLIELKLSSGISNHVTRFELIALLRAELGPLYFLDFASD